MKISELIAERFNNDECYVLAYLISKVELGVFNGALKDINDYEIDDDNILELIVFNKNKEVKKQRGLEPVESIDTSDYIDERVFINERFSTRYKRLIVRNNLDYNNDDDKIVYVKSTRFLGLEG